jgi:hypothetical protein
MKEFSADIQFTIWWINLDQLDSLTDNKQKHMRWVLIEKLDVAGATLEHKKKLNSVAFSPQANYTAWTYT